VGEATDVLLVEPSASASPRTSRAVWWTVLGIMLVSLALECWAIPRDLPHVSEVDEPLAVRPALHIAATGDLNPHWFGHPASTSIYPLAGLYHVWDAVAHGGPLFSSNPDLARPSTTSRGEFFFIGRLWSIAFAVGAIPLVFLLGRRCFSTAVGLVGASLWALVPLAVHYGRIARSDSAAWFFALLSLLLIVRLLDHPTLRNHLLAGVSIGLGVSARYFIVTLIPVLAAGGVIAMHRNVPGASFRRIGAGVGAAVVTFLLTTPFFLLDWPAARRSLEVEWGPHPGHDGFSRLGNLRWYLGNAIPNTITWPVAILAVAGIVLMLVRRRNARQLLLLAAAVLFVVGISMSDLHWERWPLPILPLATLFAAHALVTVVSALRAPAGQLAPAPATAVGLALVAILPAKEVLHLNALHSRPSTRLEAREWIAAHVPRGSIVVKEQKTAPLEGMGLRAIYSRAVAESDRTVDEYRADGVQYFIMNAAVSGAFRTQPSRYPTEAAFYRQLLQESCLMHEFRPNAHVYGPTISIYELMPVGAGCGARPHF
jgi:4-amino-4-deoxy-L-arabinose transferase-like glycosyltransferase